VSDTTMFNAYSTADNKTLLNKSYFSAR